MTRIIFILIPMALMGWLFLKPKGMSAEEKALWDKAYESGIDRNATYKVTYKNGNIVRMKGAVLQGILIKETNQLKDWIEE